MGQLCTASIRQSTAEQLACGLPHMETLSAHSKLGDSQGAFLKHQLQEQHPRQLAKGNAAGAWTTLLLVSCRGQQPQAKPPSQPLLVEQG
jgi:hypothetical protein